MKTVILLSCLLATACSSVSKSIDVESQEEECPACHYVREPLNRSLE